MSISQPSAGIKESVLERTQDDLIKHEGYIDRIYLDSEGLRTFGVGHLVGRNDPEWTWPVDTPVSEARILLAFEEDFNEAVNDACKIIPNLEAHPEEVQSIIINMAFNLGFVRLSKFKKMIAAVRACDYATAALEMKDSKWYRQVKRRGEELVKRMEQVASSEVNNG